MAAGPFEADLAMPFGVPARGGSVASPKLVAILKPGTTSWIAQKTSKYTIHAWGPGGTQTGSGAGAGGYARKTLQIAKGTVLSCSIGVGGRFSGSDANNQVPSGPTTISGPDLSLSCAAGSTITGGSASGGDINIPGGDRAGNVGGSAGGDGTVIGTGGVGGILNALGGHPGGGGGGGSSIIVSGSGEIRIVDETP